MNNLIIFTTLPMTCENNNTSTLLYLNIIDMNKLGMTRTVWVWVAYHDNNYISSCLQ